MNGVPGLPMLSRGFFEREVAQVARDLVGARLLLGGVGGTVVETEAYDRGDPASHRGRAARNASMLGPAGHATCTAPAASAGAWTSSAASGRQAPPCWSGRSSPRPGWG